MLFGHYKDMTLHRQAGPSLHGYLAFPVVLASVGQYPVAHPPVLEFLFYKNKTWIHILLCNTRACLSALGCCIVFHSTNNQAHTHSLCKYWVIVYRGVSRWRWNGTMDWYKLMLYYWNTAYTLIHYPEVSSVSTMYTTLWVTKGCCSSIVLSSLIETRTICLVTLLLYSTQLPSSGIAFMVICYILHHPNWCEAIYWTAMYVSLCGMPLLFLSSRPYKKVCSFHSHIG